MAAEWTYLLADLLTGAVKAEVPLSGVRISTRLNDAGTMSGTWNLGANWSGDSPSVLTMPDRTMGVALRDGRPVWAGVLLTRRRTSGNPGLELGFSDWWALLDRRYVLPPFTPDGTTSQVAVLSTSFTQVDQNDIVRQLVAQAQAATGGNLGIQVDTTVSGILRDRTYAGHELVTVGQALKQLAEIIDGPDLLFGVSPELDANGRPVKTLRIGTPKLGQEGSPHVFEYGGNLISYQWGSDGTKMATRWFATGEGIEAGQLIAVNEDDERYSEGWPILEGDANHSTVSEDVTLQDHADADRERNRLPVITPTIVVAGNGLNARGVKVGPSLAEYGIGDEVRVVIRDEFFTGAGLDSTFRIVAQDLDPGDGGVESVSLVLNPVLDVA